MSPTSSSRSRILAGDDFCRVGPLLHIIKIRYYQETDTLYIDFRDAEIAETWDLDETTLLVVDSKGTFCAITVEHTSDIIVTGDQCNGESN